MSSTAAASRMNLAALQRVDSAVTEIIDNASQVALYKFGAATNNWEKTEIEGALFVFAWSKSPRHGFIVMNRLSTTNLLQVITQDVEFQAQSPFLLYKSNGGIFCVWFYDAKECDRIGKLFQSLTMSSSKPRYRQRCASESDGRHPHNTRDIVTLLARAKDEYNLKKVETASSSCSQKRRGERGGRQQQQQQQQPAASCPPPCCSSPPVLHKPRPVRTNGAPSTPLSVESLFAAASVPREPSDARESLMRALLANPDNRLEHVEQRPPHAAGPLPPPADEVSTQLRAASCQANLLSSCWEEEEEEGGPLLPPVVTPAMLQAGGRLATGSPPQQQPLLREGGRAHHPPAPSQAPPATSDLPLLTPMAFTRPSGHRDAPAFFPLAAAECAWPPPAGVVNGEVGPRPGGRPAVPALTKDQLRDALIHMLQTDDGFLLKLHEAYVGSLRCRLNLDTSSSSSPPPPTVAGERGGQL